MRNTQQKQNLLSQSEPLPTINHFKQQEFKENKGGHIEEVQQFKGKLKKIKSNDSRKHKKQKNLLMAKKQSNASSKSEELIKKRVIILIPLTIPATGKSTMFRSIKEGLTDYYVDVLSCDKVRAQKMERLLKKDSTLTKQEAENIVNPAANKKYYKMLAEDLKEIEKNDEIGDAILFLDRNHTETSIKRPLQQIKLDATRCKGLDIKVVAIIPKCEDVIKVKNKFHYPFSSCYIASCARRVLQRAQHETLEGTQITRVNRCVCFANMFRNFAFTTKNLQKYFNSVIRLPFHIQQEIPKQITEDIIKIMLGNKPGCYDVHPRLEQLIKKIKAWEIKQDNQVEFDIRQVKKIIEKLFENFDELQVDVENFPGEQQDSVYEYDDDYYEKEIIKKTMEEVQDQVKQEIKNNSCHKEPKLKAKHSQKQKGKHQKLPQQSQ